MRYLLFLVFFGVSHAALQISPSHHGQVLIIPVYAGHAEASQSLVSLINAGTQWSAVRIRVVPGGGADVLPEVNMYLRPRERAQFVFATVDGDLVLGINDSSTEACTVPDHLMEDGFARIVLAESATEQQMSGFIEVIEMGTIDQAALPDANCDDLRARWADGGAWQADADADLLLPAGRIMGNAWLIDVNQGDAYPIQPIAVSGYSQVSQHGFPGSATPNLASATTTQALISLPDGQRLLTFDSPLDAMTALFMATEHRVEVHADEALNGSTELIVTFPTLWLYGEDDSPFSNLRGPLVFPFDLSGRGLFEYPSPCDQPQFLRPPNFDDCAHARVDVESRFYVLSYPPDSRPITNSAWPATVSHNVDRADVASAIVVWSGNSDVFENTRDNAFAFLSATTEGGSVELHGQPAVVTVLNGVTNGQMTDDSGYPVLANYGSAFRAIPTRLLLEAMP